MPLWLQPLVDITTTINTHLIFNKKSEMVPMISLDISTLKTELMTSPDTFTLKTALMISLDTSTPKTGPMISPDTLKHLPQMSPELPGKPLEIPQEPLLPSKRDSNLSTTPWLPKTTPMMSLLPTKRSGTMPPPEST